MVREDGGRKAPTHPRRETANWTERSKPNGLAEHTAVECAPRATTGNLSVLMQKARIYGAMPAPLRAADRRRACSGDELLEQRDMLTMGRCDSEDQVVGLRVPGK